MDQFASNSATDDEAEIAQVQALTLNANALAAHQQKMAEESRRLSSAHCVSCGDPIPEERRLAIKGVQECIRCKEIGERPW